MEIRLEHTCESGPETREPGELRHRRRQTAFAVTGLLVVTIAALLLNRPCAFEERASVVQNHLAKLEQGVDPDSAAWFELAQLPGLGETLAKRIVAFRERARTGREQSGRVFTRPADLMQVSGVGGRTVHRIGPFLRFGTGHSD